MNTYKRETGEEIKARVNKELAGYRSQIEEGLRTGKQNAALAVRAVAFLDEASPEWFLKMRDSKQIDAAGDLIRHLVLGWLAS